MSMGPAVATHVICAPPASSGTGTASWDRVPSCRLQSSTPSSPTVVKRGVWPSSSSHCTSWMGWRHCPTPSSAPVTTSHTRMAHSGKAPTDTRRLPARWKANAWSPWRWCVSTCRHLPLAVSQTQMGAMLLFSTPPEPEAASFPSAERAMHDTGAVWRSRVRCFLVWRSSISTAWPTEYANVPESECQSTLLCARPVYPTMDLTSRPFPGASIFALCTAGDASRQWRRGRGRSLTPPVKSAGSSHCGSPDAAALPPLHDTWRPDAEAWPDCAGSAAARASELSASIASSLNRQITTASPCPTLTTRRPWSANLTPRTLSPCPVKL
mmetsp:Transcript_60923/g.193254  ORF Transcript_60923/g.193254 Transcript_60923/m.193254 type:complete len:325 (+) Transcript_60923:1304-2278(+)